MSKAYFYFAATLPMLEFESASPFSLEDFLLDCERLLDKHDFETITNALEASEPDESVENDLVKDWKEFSHNLRNEAAWIRATEANKDPVSVLRGARTADALITDIMMQTDKSPDPLTTEKIIDQGRWKRLDELAAGHGFDLETIIVYAIKLKILSRYREIESAKGEDIFEGYKKDLIFLQDMHKGVTT